ncbi:Putative uncharacterized protein [Pararhodospirillum photometricum DSM 122]|uniref:Uncharacterized protein n=2 Tax=Pararhodospirillum photometricum TaxID=1084 RepID=H6SN38_PARPM|nr:Putative uncharacterized protein [Pararhodospirillum photometricum DSM 122]
MGVWELKDFHIEYFEPLDSAPLSSVIEDLHEIQGHEWGEVEDPWGLLYHLRTEIGEIH